MIRILLLCCVLLAGTFSMRSQDRGFGLGIIIGDPTGLSGKYWVSSTSAIDGGLAWSFRHSGYFHLHGDYLWHFLDAIKSQEKFLPYVGIGGRFGATKRDALLGIRVVGGITFIPRGAPIDIFLELAPILDLAPATELEMNGGIGIRYFFR